MRVLYPKRTTELIQSLQLSASAAPDEDGGATVGSDSSPSVRCSRAGIKHVPTDHPPISDETSNIRSPTPDPTAV